MHVTRLHALQCKQCFGVRTSLLASVHCEKVSPDSHDDLGSGMTDTQGSLDFAQMPLPILGLC